MARLELSAFPLLAFVASIYPTPSLALSEFYNFDDDLLPAGWSIGFLDGSPGTNASIRNGRFEIGQIDTYAFLERPLQFAANTSEVQISYTGNLASVYWGMGTAVWTKDSLGGITSSVEFSKHGYGQNLLRRSVSGSASGTQAGPQFLDFSSPTYGTYDISVSLKNGQISQTASLRGSQLEYSTGYISVPGFSLNEISSLAMFGVTTTGESAWIDNLRIDSISSQAPINYGLFIGVSDDPGTPESERFRGDLAAQLLADRFNQLPNSTSQSLVADINDPNGLTSEKIESALAEIYSRMRPDDTMVVYFAAHGGPILGTGDEYIRLRESTRFYDDSLADMLRPYSDVNKIVMIDACHSGGFWGSLDPLETFGTGDLDTVAKTALLASSSELGLSYYTEDGIPIMAVALEYGWSRGDDSFFLSDSNKDNIITLDEWVEYIENFEFTGESPTIVFESAFGDPIAFSPDLIAPIAAAGADFDGALNVSPVPEPSGAILMLAGLLALRSSRVRSLHGRISPT